MEQETSLQRERSRIAQDLHDDIGSSLNHIALLSELAQKDFEKPLQAREHLDHIFLNARKVVRSLDEIVWTVNPKNDTLDVFVAYLCTYAPDYLRSAGIRCRLDVPVDVPAMPLQTWRGASFILSGQGNAAQHRQACRGDGSLAADAICNGHDHADD